MSKALETEQELITGLINDHNENVNLKFNEDDDFETRKAMSSALYVELFEALKATTNAIDFVANLGGENAKEKQELVDYMAQEINDHTDRVNSKMNGFGLLPEQRQYELGLEFYGDLYQVALNFVEKVSK